MEPDPIHLGQHIVRAISSANGLAIMSLSIYIDALFDVEFKLTISTAILIVLWNSIIFYGYWAYGRGRKVAPSILATMTLVRLLFGGIFILILSSISAGLVAAVDLKNFHAGAGISDFEANPWRMIVFGLQIGNILLFAAIVGWNIATCVQQWKAYRADRFTWGGNA
ncbi:hypothetical protein BN1723_011462 [Verticillium longisporum]|uniref:Uncharacterized protein n=1 Tax=Verticillium longisporum TaxID=100787 RepID=A0A0G4MVU6_VERLO|nr:hypothetical protein BN1723_011462 [Verticillium longisporum]CRK38313.1 hypothetical protein BN1708_007703 [Verticillium longisporum]